MKRADEVYRPLGEFDSSSTEHWRERTPYLVVIPQIFTVEGWDPAKKSSLDGLGKLTPTLDSPFIALRDAALPDIVHPFESSGSQVVEYQAPEMEPTFLNLARLRVKNKYRKDEFYSSLEQYVILQFIDLGEFSEDQEETFKIPVYDSRSQTEFMRAYNAVTPEVVPSVWMRSLQMGLSQPLPGNFINVLGRRVKPGSGIPENFEPRKKQGLQWVDMAHFGSFKVLELFYSLDENQQAIFESMMLGTLEGSHVLLDHHMRFVAREMGRRIRIFGQTKEVGGAYSIDKSMRPIPRQEWAQLPAVQGMMRLGRFLGDRSLISDPVSFDYLNYNDELRERSTKLTRYSRQAESAVCLHEPRIDRLIVSKTGRLGVIKTKPEAHDFVAVYSDTAGDITLTLVGDEELPDEPSIEAKEFARPLSEMARDEPGFAFKVRLNEDGTYTEDEAGEYTAWRIAGIQHLHRDVQRVNLDKIVIITPEDADAVGCGVDANDEKSRYAIKQAYAKAKQFFAEKGYWPTAAVFYVPNHGWNALLMSISGENGDIDPDLTKPYMEAVENGDIIYTDTVTQV